MRHIAKNKEVGDLVWIPAGVKLWQLLDEDKKIPKYKFRVIDEPKYLLVTGKTKRGDYLVTMDGDTWHIG